MKFSVLMSAYNAEPFIGEAIGSVLSQTHSDFELLIVDDGSTDATSDVIAGFDDVRIRSWRQDNAGKSVAMNAMLDTADSDCIVLLDADDLSPPQRLARIEEYLAASPDLGAVLSGYALLLDGKTVAPRCEAKSRERTEAEIRALRLPSHDPTIACRMETAQRIRFDTTLRVMQGVDFVFQIAEAAPMEVIGECLYLYRVHAMSNTRRNPERRARYFRLALDRIRARRGEQPLDDETFERAFGSAARDPSNLTGHFTDSAYQQLVSSNRRGAIDTAMAGLRLLPPGAGRFKPAIYALSPIWLANRIRSRGASSSSR